MRVAAIVVNWNGAEHLAGCLDALFGQDHDDLDVVVVDNASSDGSLDVLARYPRVRVVRNPTNRGYAGGANDGLRATDAPVVIVCNPDTRPRPDYVRVAVAALDADPRRGAIQGKLIRTVRSPAAEPVIDTTGHVAFRTRLFRNRGEGEVDRGQLDKPGRVFGVSGAFAVYRRAMLDDVADEGEVFDEDLFAFWEDVDLDWRAAMRGWVAWYESAAVGEHERGGAGPRRTARVEALNHRNRLLTLVKCDDLTAVLADAPGVLVSSVLKAGELALTVPSAFIASLGGVRLVPRMLAKRRRIHARATVPSRVVVARWFRPFDWGAWIRTWWRRVRGVPLGS